MSHLPLNLGKYKVNFYGSAASTVRKLLWFHIVRLRQSYQQLCSVVWFERFGNANACTQLFICLIVCFYSVVFINLSILQAKQWDHWEARWIKKQHLNLFIDGLHEGHLNTASLLVQPLFISPSVGVVWAIHLLVCTFDLSARLIPILINGDL